MKLPLITDIHYGMRNDHPSIIEASRLFLDNVYFPYLLRHNCQWVVCLGDLLERRKYVNFNTARRLRQDFVEPHDAMGIRLDVIVGNHDVFYRSTNDLCGVEELYNNTTLDFNLYKGPIEVTTCDDTKILYVPWINQENRAQVLEAIDKTTARICLGHLELKDFAFDKNTIALDGEDRAIFSKFDFVGSGHYHHKSSQDNIHYLGSHMEFTWADHDDPKGFHVLDTKTLELEFIENPYTLHEKLFYSEEKIDMREVVETYDFSQLSGKYVKVVVNDRKDTVLFDLFMDKIEEVGPADIQTVDDFLSVETVVPDAEVDETQDTLTIVRNAVSASKTDGIDDNHLNTFITDLYQEALSVST